MILYSQPLYERLAPWLVRFERRQPFRELAVERTAAGDGHAEVFVFGLGRYGSRLLAQLHADGVRAAGVDFDPEAVRALQHRGPPVYFGDGEDPEFLASLPLAQARWVITTFPQLESNRALLHALHEVRYGGPVAAAVRDPVHGRALAEAGVPLILNPFEDAADHAARRLADELRVAPRPLEA
jgi:Trk K+ transport system NAD-binding subunit